MNNIIFKLLNKWSKEIGYIIKLIIVIFIIAYTAFFIKFGFDFAQTSEFSTLKKIFIGLLFTIVGIILFFISEFSGGVNFDLRWLIFFIGLAIGGSIVGLIAGELKGFVGWILGISVGITIIILTIRLLFKYREKDT